MSKTFLTILAVLAVLFTAPAFACPGKDNCPFDEKGNCPKAHMMEVDTDKDGTISKEEFINSHTKRFEEIDTDKDGSLNAEERQAFHKKMKDKMSKWGKKAQEAKGTPKPDAIKEAVEDVKDVIKGE